MNNSYDWENNKKVFKKSSLHDFLRNEVVLQKVASKMVATQCYWKFNTEVIISEFFEKLCHLIIDQKGKVIILKS